MALFEVRSDIRDKNQYKLLSPDTLVTSVLIEWEEMRYKQAKVVIPLYNVQSALKSDTHVLGSLPSSFSQRNSVRRGSGAGVTFGGGGTIMGDSFGGAGASQGVRRRSGHGEGHKVNDTGNSSQGVDGGSGNDKEALALQLTRTQKELEDLRQEYR